ncbi:hypothetical protein P3X46_018861 [Hevea brasiliensis]|uniref:Anaphase-promoting complex subunit 4 WD40 domain-containing protein n=1 Tax=Hevea brasiliensis TaxID=3981 RepID=A0ABQ9LS47_HEVBR|nr:protein JINGUBANG-like [Hevea brasiliensis]KAJ9170782.1 hypothetical protein P3X46_018861 [Hevea brasiliensis]
MRGRAKADAWFFYGERSVLLPGHGHSHRIKSSDGGASSILSMNGSSAQDFSFFNFDSASSAFNNDVLPPSPLRNYPWPSQVNLDFEDKDKDKDYDNNDQVKSPNVLMGSLVREEGHIHSLATSGDLLYTGSDGKNIRVWKNQKEFSGFKSNSGLVKAIVISEDTVFTGHQDGKIRLWKLSSKNPCVHKRVGTLPKFKDYFKSSIKPSNYIEIGRNRNMVWRKNFGAISSLSLSEDKTLLYSVSGDKTFKVWRISDSKCLESVAAHNDAVNSIVAGFDGLVFTGSADGSIKVWRRELQGKGTKHFFSQTLLKQECTVTTLAVNPEATIIYSGSSEGLVNFWERKMQLSHGGVLRGHKSAVLCLVTAGSLVFSGSADTGICVWRRLGSDHICLSLLNGHTGPVKCLAAEKDEKSISHETPWILYSASVDKSVKMWRVSENAPPVAWNGCASAMPISLPPARSSDRSRINHRRH